ncbi:hypothetical protein BDD12DRAFT_360649 [Trichophaea hybrida]|nr:hypothetical protein BDD12DRAFT_360649 [Trichophaea hybrida]
MTLPEDTDSSAIFARLKKAIYGVNQMTPTIPRRSFLVLLYVDEIFTIYPCTEAAIIPAIGIKYETTKSQTSTLHVPRTFTYHDPSRTFTVHIDFSASRFTLISAESGKMTAKHRRKRSREKIWENEYIRDTYQTLHRDDYQEVDRDSLEAAYQVHPRSRPEGHRHLFRTTLLRSIYLPMPMTTEVFNGACGSTPHELGRAQAHLNTW